MTFCVVAEDMIHIKTSAVGSVTVNLNGAVQWRAIFVQNERKSIRVNRENKNIELNFV